MICLAGWGRASIRVGSNSACAIRVLGILALAGCLVTELAEAAEKGEGQKAPASQPSSRSPSPPANHLPLEPDMSCSAANDQPPASFRVSLTPEQEERAMAVYRRSIVITAHDHCFHPDDFLDWRTRELPSARSSSRQTVIIAWKVHATGLRAK